MNGITPRFSRGRKWRRSHFPGSTYTRNGRQQQDTTHALLHLVPPPPFCFYFMNDIRRTAPARLMTFIFIKHPTRCEWLPFKRMCTCSLRRRRRAAPVTERANSRKLPFYGPDTLHYTSYDTCNIKFTNSLLITHLHPVISSLLETLPSFKTSSSFLISIYCGVNLKYTWKPPKYGHLWDHTKVSSLESCQLHIHMYINKKKLYVYLHTTSNNPIFL